MAKMQRLVRGARSPKLKTPAGPPKKAARRQRGQVPLDSLVPLQFRMPADFVRQFKQEALNRGLKLTDLFALSFKELRKSCDPHSLNSGPNR
jgi:hypothetical protein